ncbi:hypothetical protein DBV39_08685 [Orrella marina]|uniref:Uncharacterized protein n=1 Tax=Orrella marina TaxID=2163011 RepID=A0A2R4XIY9_9BURK|nr:hypothetical protein DBV39_08685 [Orrella marina]
MLFVSCYLARIWCTPLDGLKFVGTRLSLEFLLFQEGISNCCASLAFRGKGVFQVVSDTLDATLSVSVATLASSIRRSFRATIVVERFVFFCVRPGAW